MLPEAVNVLMLVVKIFDSLQIPYFIGGSMASAFHGVARSTLDADLVVDLQMMHVEKLVKTLGDDFYADEELIRDAIHHQSSFNLIHLATMFKVDVFIRKDRPFDTVQFQRRVGQILATNPEQTAFVTTSEDIILAKLDWFRQGNEISDRQWRDILGVLKVQAGRLNFDYLRLWAQELNVADLLQRALKESE